VSTPAFRAQPTLESRAAELVAELAAFLPPEELITDHGERVALSTDVYGGAQVAALVIRPRDRHRLARALGLATGRGFAVVTRGGGMSYTGGYVPVRPDTLLVDTSGLDRILRVAPEDMLITVEAGVTWKRIYDTLKPLGLRLPFFGTHSGSRATVGGGLSNGALFFGTARHGTAADNVLAIEVALADGTLVKTGQAGFRHVSKPFYRTYGPDLTGLFLHDSGGLGVKVEATFRLIRTPAHTGHVSFVFPDIETTARALSEVARTGAAEEAYVFDPASTAKNLEGADLRQDLKTLAGVVKAEGSFLKGLKEGAKLVAAGRDFGASGQYSLHVTATGRTERALEDELEALREAAVRSGGAEIANSIPKAVRGSLFPPLDGVLGPKGDRWAALNAKVAHSDAVPLVRACEALLETHSAEMQSAGVWMTRLLIAQGTHAFSYEPVFHWFDEWLPVHERTARPEFLAGLERPAANPRARALVEKLRAELVAIFAAHGAASNQIGKTYPYFESLEPATAAVLAKLKAALDPGKAMNAGSLTFERRGL
jgi:FAD/FMN-containing dehydrogenase